MKKIAVFLAGMLFSAFIFAETPEEIIKKIDYNQAPESVVYTAKMTISQNGKINEKEMKMYGKGKDKSFIEFYAPPRDKGTKYLRIQSDLQMYMPSAEKTIKISGHMLRQGMMGSDFSYEDQTERTKLFDNYSFVISGEDEINGNKTYIIELEAKPGVEVTYYKRKLWVDKAKYIVYKSEMYAKSGKLLKLLTAGEVKKIGSRYYATYLKMEDKLKGGSYSEIRLTNIELDKEISDEVFTKTNLERKN